MFVLTGEGQRWLDRALWTTHKVLGVFATREDALALPLLVSLDDEDIVVLTDTATGTAERVDVGPTARAEAARR